MSTRKETMHRLPRSEWIDWCEDHNRSGLPRLQLSDEEHRYLVALLDYAPFDDILELDLVEAGATERRLVDHPSEIVLANEHIGRLLIRTPGETITLTILPTMPTGALDDSHDARPHLRITKTQVTTSARPH